MRDLFVFTADADALAVVRAVLSRPKAIGIREIDFEVDRHVQHDPGMVTNGPEIVRMRVQKAACQNVLLLWDHHGSGWDQKTPDEARKAIRLRLDQATWRDRSEAVVIVPELEEWLWHNPASIARRLGVAVGTLEQWAGEFAEGQGTDYPTCKEHTPKELFRNSVYRCRKGRPLPEDFEQIALRAGLKDWQKSPTFAAFVTILRTWFPK
jgi:hypothetical protein